MAGVAAWLRPPQSPAARHPARAGLRPLGHGGSWDPKLATRARRTSAPPNRREVAAQSKPPVPHRRARGWPASQASVEHEPASDGGDDAGRCEAGATAPPVAETGPGPRRPPALRRECPRLSCPSPRTHARGHRRPPPRGVAARAPGRETSCGSRQCLPCQSDANSVPAAAPKALLGAASGTDRAVHGRAALWKHAEVAWWIEVAGGRVRLEDPAAFGAKVRQRRPNDLGVGIRAEGGDAAPRGQRLANLRRAWAPKGSRRVIVSTRSSARMRE